MNETHADCLRIIVRAEMRMADAVDQGQAAGDIRTKAHNQHVRTSDKLASLGEIGIRRQRLAEWRVLRDAGIEAVDAAIDAQFAGGKAPTKSGIQAALAGYTGNDEWYTPAEWVDRAREVMGTIDCDPATLVCSANDHGYALVRQGTRWPSASNGQGTFGSIPLMRAA